MRKKKIKPLKVDHKFWELALKQGKYRLCATENGPYIDRPQVLARILKGKQEMPYPLIVVNILKREEPS